MNVAELTRRSPAELTDAIVQLHAIGNAFHRRQLALIAAYDRMEAWRADGATSMVAWTQGWLGLGRDTASEWVRVSHAFETLPKIAETYEQGMLSWDQVRAVTEFATPETDAHLADEARRFSAAHLRRMARRFKPVPVEEENDAHRDRALRMRWDLGARVLRLHGQLPAAEGAIVVKAIERVASQIAQSRPDEPYDHHAISADALTEICSAQLDADSDADRATVGVHIDASVLTGGSGMAEVDGAGAVALETARRLACDSRWYIVVDGPDGRPLGIGRVNRQIPAWLSREIRHRDSGCRFPGCGRKRWAAIHHILPWGQGGSTDYDNLVMLCGYHHRKLHEGGWRVEGEPNRDLRFIAPDGRVWTQGPPPLREEVGRRVGAIADAAVPPHDRALAGALLAGTGPAP
ncbi:MAG: DUF222 domain-containing protein [Actinomycetota bacterium]